MCVYCIYLGGDVCILYIGCGCGWRCVYIVYFFSLYQIASVELIYGGLEVDEGVCGGRDV